MLLQSTLVLIEIVSDDLLSASDNRNFELFNRGCFVQNLRLKKDDHSLESMHSHNCTTKNYVKTTRCPESRAVTATLLVVLQSHITVISNTDVSFSV